MGTVVAEQPKSRAEERFRILEQEVEQLVVGAKRVGLELDGTKEAIETQWLRLEKALEVSRK